MNEIKSKKKQKNNQKNVMKILFRDCFELNSVYLIGTSRAFIVFRTINSDIYRYIGFDSNAFSELKVTE